MCTNADLHPSWFFASSGLSITSLCASPYARSISSIDSISPLSLPLPSELNIRFTAFIILIQYPPVLPSNATMQFLSSITLVTAVISLAKGLALPQPDLNIIIKVDDVGHSKSSTASDLFRDDGQREMSCLGEDGKCLKLSRLLGSEQITEVMIS
ncbi:hypothetical protein DL98DRAFT_164647 [Cadophora sp. DSE1049]|nr:hypothetical protein DL98DRAFT_164647 [Cadophora sp. DSE1049]